MKDILILIGITALASVIGSAFALVEPPDEDDDDDMGEFDLGGEG